MDDRFLPENQYNPHRKEFGIARSELKGRIVRLPKVPGVPTYAENLFILMFHEKLGNGAFKWARESLKHMSDDEVWQAYELWLDNKAHPKLSEK